MAKFVVISLIFAAVLTQLAESKPYQNLSPKPGYVPVYIRIGNQPLIDINPILAEAFREHDISARNIKIKKDSESMETPNLNLSSLLPSSKVAEEFLHPTNAEKLNVSESKSVETVTN